MTWAKQSLLSMFSGMIASLALQRNKCWRLGFITAELRFGQFAIMLTFRGAIQSDVPVII
jgi:hypothetical protein